MPGGWSVCHFETRCYGARVNTALDSSRPLRRTFTAHRVAEDVRRGGRSTSREGSVDPFEDERRRAFIELTDWDARAHQVDVTKDISEAEKQAAKDTLQLLRAEFGDGFLRRLVRHGVTASFIRNRAPWTRRWLPHLGEALTTAQQLAGYAGLRRRLSRGESFAEGMSVLWYAYKFTRVGFTVALDHPVKVGRSTKKPDLRLELPGSRVRFHAEVSQLGPSEEDGRAWETLHRVSDALFASGLCFSSMLARPLSAVEEKVLMAGLQERIEETRSKGFGTLEIPGVCLIGLSTEDGLPGLEEWCARHDRDVGDLGMHVPDDSPARLTGRLSDKKKQLPADTENLVLLPTHSGALARADWSTLAEAISEELGKHPHVAAVIVSTSYIGGSEEGTVHLGPHRLIRRSRAGLVRETYLVVAQPGSESSPLVERACAAVEHF